LLGNKESGFVVNRVSNPIQHTISVDYMTPHNGEVLFSLFDSYGKLVSETIQKATNGSNKAELAGLQQLAAGIYTISLTFENVRISKRVVRVNGR
jgi:Secretion system C-terminal sorting domain